MVRPTDRVAEPTPRALKAVLRGGCVPAFAAFGKPTKTCRSPTLQRDRAELRVVMVRLERSSGRWEFGAVTMARRLFGLLVGIDSYLPPVPQLAGCVNDIEAIAALLGQFAETDEFQLSLQLLKNAEATRSAIVDGFMSHLSKAGPDDVVLFYYSGHGSQEETPPELWHVEPDRLNETLVCYDSRQPGQWDLADKELAVLIAQVAERGPHVVCILDCCHSGSGTRASVEGGIVVRRAPTDRRRRPFHAFLDGVTPSKAVTKSATSRTGWPSMPAGHHVLLAACQASETAKEVLEGSTRHGAFTLALLDVLRQTRGAVTYQDLAKRAEAEVRRRVSQQVPQLELGRPEDLRRTFLGGAIRRRKPHFTLRHDRALGWVVDGGAIHGIPGPYDGETTTLAIFEMDASPEPGGKVSMARAMALVNEVRPGSSCVTVEVPSGGELDTSKSYRATIVAMPLPVLGIFLTGDSAALETVRKFLGTASGGGSGSLLVREVATEDEGALRLEAVDGEYRICRCSASRQLVTANQYSVTNAVRIVFDRLEHIARWETVARLENPGSGLGDAQVKLVIKRPVKDLTGNETWEEIDPRQELRLHYEYLGGRWRGPRLRIEIHNQGKTDVYCALLWLGEDYAIDSALLPAGIERIPAGHHIEANGGKEIYGSVPDKKWREGRTEVRDLLKLIVSTTEFDPRLFDQEALDMYSRSRASLKLPRNVLNRLATRVHFRDLATRDPDDDIVDWATSAMSLTVVRPLDAVTVPASGGERELCAGVRLLGHPTLRARARLVSPSEIGRHPDSVGLPPILRDDPDISQPFLFETPRGTDPGLSALELVDVENADSVTATSPLVLRMKKHRLKPHEQVLATAWDGEFFLPVGTARLMGDELEIRLRQFPIPRETGSSEDRAVVRSIRILFQKMISSALGTKFGYPRLSAVRFDHNKRPVRETSVDRIREAVASATRIVLFMHGIFGDTTSMIGSIYDDPSGSNEDLQCIRDRYELVLAFDYENIGTPIELSASNLKGRLEEVGLGRDHGKALHVVGHSMGGLIARWFIEREGGSQVIQHLVMLGTPHGGSPWPTIQGWATAAVALALNGFAKVAWPAKLVADLVAAIETVDVTLDQMEPGSTFLAELARSADPKVPYTLVAGNTSVIPFALESGRISALFSRLSAQRILHSATSLAFLNDPNDIAVSLTSAAAIPAGHTPAPRLVEVGCDHLTYFSSQDGRHVLATALQRI